MCGPYPTALLRAMVRSGNNLICITASRAACCASTSKSSLWYSEPIRASLLSSGWLVLLPRRRAAFERDDRQGSYKFAEPPVCLQQLFRIITVQEHSRFL